jgi:hypothetical protein
LKRNAGGTSNFLQKVWLIVDMTMVALFNPRLAPFSDISGRRVVAAMLHS